MAARLISCPCSSGAGSAQSRVVGVAQSLGFPIGNLVSSCLSLQGLRPGPPCQPHQPQAGPLHSPELGSQNLPSRTLVRSEATVVWASGTHCEARLQNPGPATRNRVEG